MHGGCLAAPSKYCPPAATLGHLSSVLLSESSFVHFKLSTESIFWRTVVSVMETTAEQTDSPATKTLEGAKPIDASPPVASVSSSSSSPCSSSSTGTNHTSPAVAFPKKRKESLPALSQALPHPAELRPIKAAAVSKSLLKFRKEKLRDAVVARKVSRRFPVLNKLWAELLVDLDDDGTRCDVCGNYDTLPVSSCSSHARMTFTPARLGTSRCQ